MIHVPFSWLCKGGIHRVNVTTGAVKQIPFSIDDVRDVIDPPRPQVAVAPDQFQTKMPRFASYSPDGSKAVFESMGKLWLKNAKSDKAKRLSSNNSDRRELFPSWSRDGDPCPVGNHLWELVVCRRQ